MRLAETSAPGRRRLPSGRREAIAGVALLLPVLGLVGGLAVWPIVHGVGLSLTDARLLSPETAVPVGLANYRRLVTDPLVGRYALNTLVWAGGKISGQLALGLVLAVLLNRAVRLRGPWRATVLLPWAMPVVVSAMSWRWILDGQFGVLNRALTAAGLLREPVTWLVDPTWMWPSVIAVHTWQFFPFMYLSFLAGLQTVSHELREAAALDGAGAWRTFRYVTWPLLRPVAAVNGLLALIWSLGDFSAIWTLTQGGPGGLTTTLAPFVYLTTFRFGDVGYGAALAIVLMLATGSLTAVYLGRVRFAAG